jgi:hypothetical protein
MDQVHVDVDRGVVVHDAGRLQHLAVPDDASESADQVPEFQFLDRLHRRLGPPSREVVGQARQPLLPITALLVQNTGRIAVLLVHQQPLDQFLAWVFDLLGFLAASRQHHPGLDLHQRAGHLDKVGSEIDIQFLKDLQVAQELLGNRRHEICVTSNSFLRTRYSSRSKGPRNMSRSTWKLIRSFALSG